MNEIELVDNTAAAELPNAGFSTTWSGVIRAYN
jgi:hypothetical protein